MAVSGPVTCAGVWIKKWIEILNFSIEFFAREASMKSENGKKKEEKWKNENTRLLNFSISSGIFTKISQNFPNFLQSSLSLDILEHVREIPTKFHLNFGEK